MLPQLLQAVSQKRNDADLSRPLHDDEAGALQMLHKSLSDDFVHERPRRTRPPDRQSAEGGIRSYGESACAPRRRVLLVEGGSTRIIVDESGS